MISKKELHILCQTANKAAKAAGKYIQSQFDQHYDKIHKQGGDSLASQIVTTVDFKAQEIILQNLQASIQQYDLGILTEESADDQSRLEKPYFWCVDPLDGTLAFTKGHSGYAVSIALVSREGDPVIGVVYVPDLGASYTSVKGAGVWLNEKAFLRKTSIANDTLHLYLDRSLQSEPYYEMLIKHIGKWAEQNKADIQKHFGFGAVCNALAVMNSGTACYLKFPKKPKGGGSIWDYAATRLFFEELGLWVSNSFGEKLSLNNPETTFMNEEGIIYSSNSAFSNFIIELRQQLKDD